MENTILPIFALAFVSRPNECKKLFFTHHNVLSVWIKEGGGAFTEYLTRKCYGACVVYVYYVCYFLMIFHTFVIIISGFKITLRKMLTCVYYCLAVTISYITLS